MARSLSDAAKAVIAKEPKAEQLSEDAKSSLKPKSGHADAPQKLEGEVQVLPDQPHKPGDGSNSGAAAASPISKDKSAPTKSAKAPQPPVKLTGNPPSLSEEEEVEEELLPEEITDFIDSLVAEGLSEDEIMEELNKVLAEAQEVDEESETVDEDAETVEEEEEVVAEEPAKIDMSEHVDALFAGEELSEEFKTKATTIFEAAVNIKLQEEIARIESIYEARLNEELEAIKTELSEDVDNYLNYIAEQWLVENEVAIESGLRTELTEDLMSGLRQLFAENYIDIPEEKVNVVEELGLKVEELEEKLNEEIQRNVDLKKALNESVKNEILHAATQGLTTTQAEKIKQLAENTAFVSGEDFEQKVLTLRENYFPANKIKQLETLDTESDESASGLISEQTLSPRMEKYVRALGGKK